MLVNDSYSNPEKILNILKAEITQIAKDYLNLLGEIKIRYKSTSEGLIFMIEMPASGIKPMFFSWFISICRLIEFQQAKLEFLKLNKLLVKVSE